MTFMVFHTPLTTPPCHIINKALISSFMTGTRLFKKHRGEKHYTNFPGKADWFNLYEGDLQGCDWCRFGADLDRPFQSWKPFSHSAPWGFFLSEEKTIGAKNTTFFHIWIRETETNKIRRFFSAVLKLDPSFLGMKQKNSWHDHNFGNPFSSLYIFRVWGTSPQLTIFMVFPGKNGYFHGQFFWQRNVTADCWGARKFPYRKGLLQLVFSFHVRSHHPHWWGCYASQSRFGHLR